MQEIRVTRAASDEYVEFHFAGDTAKGEFHCSDCGYGITIVRALPVCPMCGGHSWEQFPWSPFTRASAPI